MRGSPPADEAGRATPDTPGAAAAYPPPGPATVSVASLRHKIPKDARKAFGRAAELSKSGKYQEAAQALEEAVARDPGFAEAYGNLGAQYLRLRRDADAEAALRRAVELDPVSSSAHANLAMVLLLLRDWPAAEASARRSLELASTNSRAHYLLGLALSHSPETMTGAVRHLEYAARDLPAAAQALTAIGDR